MKKPLKRTVPVLVIAVILAAFLWYAGDYYRAEPAAQAALASDGTVAVEQTDYGWFFDGPSDDGLFVFYPGAKVEETAYAPLLRRIAASGMDVCLVKMPFRFAFFGINKADGVFAGYDRPNRYVGGHSLGGAMASVYAAGRGDELSGVILFAAYPVKPLDGGLTLMSLYGTEDGVLDMRKVAAGRGYAPDGYYEYAIEGGNHAQFGNYGEQKGDGAALISADAQQELAADFILRHRVRGVEHKTVFQSIFSPILPHLP